MIMPPSYSRMFIVPEGRGGAGRRLHLVFTFIIPVFLSDFTLPTVTWEYQSLAEVQVMY